MASRSTTPRPFCAIDCRVLMDGVDLAQTPWQATLLRVSTLCVRPQRQPSSCRLPSPRLLRDQVHLPLRRWHRPNTTLDRSPGVGDHSGRSRRGSIEATDRPLCGQSCPVHQDHLTLVEYSLAALREILGSHNRSRGRRRHSRHGQSAPRHLRLPQYVAGVDGPRIP